MDVMSSSTPEYPQEGGFLCFNGDGVAACTSCGWRGVANRIGNRVVSRPRYVHNPHDGSIEQVPGRVITGSRSSVCPACERDDDALLAEIEEEERAALELEVMRKMYAGTARNAPCPCDSGRKYKKCHGR